MENELFFFKRLNYVHILDNHERPHELHILQLYIICVYRFVHTDVFPQPGSFFFSSQSQQKLTGMCPNTCAYPNIVKEGI